MCTGLSAQKYNLLPDTIHLCSGDSASIEIRQDVGLLSDIVWTTPRGAIKGTKKIRTAVPGKYFIRFAPQNKSALNDSSYIKVYSRPEKQLVDTSICRGRTVTLDAANPGMKYLWSNGAHTQKIRVENAGRYWVKIINGRCAIYDTAMVKFHPSSAVSIVKEVTFCLNDEVKVLTAKAGPEVELLWNTGATTPTINVVREGSYYLTSNSKFCGIHTDTVKVKLKACECEMLIPNSFSPNEDNRNDYFFPVVDCEYTYFIMTITDRFGNTVFTGNSVNSKWDGRFKGNLCSEDIYVYRIESTEKVTDKKQVRTGHISLFR
jgi:gliding motility-associated-like protein